MAKDYYSVLGLERGASADEIKKAYRRLSKELHPDKHKGDKEAEQRFKEVNEAYEILSNPQKKQMYDQFGTTGQGGAGGGFGGFDFSNFQGGGGDFSGFADVFESFFGGGGGPAGGGRARRPRNEGEDMEIEIVVDLADAVDGVQKEITLDQMVACTDCDGFGYAKGSTMKTCAECDGTGQVVRTQQSFFGAIRQSFVCGTCQGAGEVPEQSCKTCNGEGRHQTRQTVAIDVPAGIEDGQALRIRGRGNAGRRGGSAGDLYVHIRVRPDARFRRDGQDIHSDLTISALDAILGAEHKVETLHGKVSLKIPEGTQPGQVLRIKGKGLPLVGSSRMGNHNVHIIVEIPKKLSRKERALLEDWRQLS